MKNLGKTKIKPYLLTALVIVAAFFAGFLVRGGKVHRHPKASAAEESSEKKIAFWTCSMHPQIKQPGPGKCPICGMDLIPVQKMAGEEEEPRELVMSETGMKLAEIQTTPVERKFVTAEVRMVGKIDYDETRLGYITAWIPGRLDRLFVDYTGTPVQKGEHMVYLYSPELISAERELLGAIVAARELEGSEISIMKEITKATVESAREKLRLWGLTSEQIAEIERSGTPSDHMTIYSPMGGIVIHKNALEGMYVNTGTRIYTIADLTWVWVRLQAYESDMVWLRYGQPIEFFTEAYPGEVFKGKIAFIDPILTEKTRTISVRVNVDNSANRLKPGMFVRAVVRARLTEDGQILSEDLAGKWIGPMHPEVVKDEPGFCDICEMPLVSAESLGYTSPDDEGNPPLVIPASAPLITGKRAVVYVRLPDRDKPTFEGREIVLGPRAGDYYIVRSGLQEGELVVTSGNFKIDSALQIMAKPSMMSPEGGVAPPAHHGGMKMPAKTKPEAAKQLKLPQTTEDQLSELLGSYFKLTEALARDNARQSANAADRARGSLKAIDMTSLSGKTHMALMADLSALERSLDVIISAENIEGQREGLALFSEAMAATLKRFGPLGDQTVFHFSCSMAFGGRGAAWLQNSEEVKNPYFGKAMPGCGELVETISSESTK